MLPQGPVVNPKLAAMNLFSLLTNARRVGAMMSVQTRRGGGKFIVSLHEDRSNAPSNSTRKITIFVYGLNLSTQKNENEHFIISQNTIANGWDVITLIYFFITFETTYLLYLLLRKNSRFFIEINTRTNLKLKVLFFSHGEDRDEI